jgi:hypothetical protein
MARRCFLFIGPLLFDVRASLPSKSLPIELDRDEFVAVIAEALRHVPRLDEADTVDVAARVQRSDRALEFRRRYGERNIRVEVLPDHAVSRVATAFVDIVGDQDFDAGIAEFFHSFLGFCGPKKDDFTHDPIFHFHFSSLL